MLMRQSSADSIYFGRARSRLNFTQFGLRGGGGGGGGA